MSLRVLFFGMQGVLSLAPLARLLDLPLEVAAVIVPAEGKQRLTLPRRVEPGPSGPSDLPLLTPHIESTIIQLAWAHRLPVWEVGKLSEPPTLAWLSEFQPEVIVVACFSQIFPPALLALPRLGCLNLHPSLLPAYRGPAPLFWQAQQGEAQTGVTLHFLNESVDSGDIVTQRHFDWPEGISEVALEQQCAQTGAELIAQAVQALARGESLPRRAQSEAEASYFPWPRADDFRVPTSWSARRAFNFLRFGLRDWPLWLEVEGQQLFVERVLGYDPTQTLAQPLAEQADGELWVRFATGVLRVWPVVMFG